jgi:hypothetical protein
LCGEYLDKPFKKEQNACHIVVVAVTSTTHPAQHPNTESKGLQVPDPSRDGHKVHRRGFFFKSGTKTNAEAPSLDSIYRYVTAYTTLLTVSVVLSTPPPLPQQSRRGVMARSML